MEMQICRELPRSSRMLNLHLFEDAREPGPRAFGLEVADESMLTRYRPGDQIVVDPDQRPKSGSPCLVEIEGQPWPLFRRFFEEGDQVVFRADAPGWESYSFEVDDPRYRIIGAVVDVVHKSL